MATQRKPPTETENPDNVSKPSDTSVTEPKDNPGQAVPAAKPPVRRRAPAKPRTPTAATPAAKAPATRTRKPAAAKAEPEVPTKDDVKEITAINDENSEQVILSNEDKPKKSKDKDKKKKKKKNKAKKEKAKKKAQKKKEKKKAKAKKKKDKKKKNKKKK